MVLHHPWEEGESERAAGVQNSFRCLGADILCLAKRVNRDISAKCDKACKSRHFSQMRQSA